MAAASCLAVTAGKGIRGRPGPDGRPVTRQYRSNRLPPSAPARSPNRLAEQVTEVLRCLFSRTAATKQQRAPGHHTP